GIRHAGTDADVTAARPDESAFAELQMLVNDFADTHGRLRQLNRVYAVRSRISALIVHAADRDALFRGACDILVGTGRFSVAWIGVVDRETPPVRILAGAGAGADADADWFADLQARLIANATSGDGMLARALAGPEAVICNDIGADPAVLE